MAINTRGGFGQKALEDLVNALKNEGSKNLQ